MSAEQMEYICPTCRWRTVVNHKPEDEQTVFCPRCEIEMKPYTKTSQIAAAAANAPAESSVGGKTKGTRSKAGTAAKAPKAAAAKKAPTKAALARAAKAAAAAPPPQPEFGEFRCACCGYVRTVAAGSEKPAGGFRCPTCFVKLDWIRA
jgi:DNA-directed RNA polymerase subunit RPC12/RpoP